MQERLLELWLGDRRDVCVVGDEDQTIYTFTGATSRFLTGFSERHADARVIELAENYRSTPQVLALANNLLASTGRSKRLVATKPPGPEPLVARHGTEAGELAALARWVGERIADGIAPAEIAILVRINAQLAPIEAGLTRAGIAYQVRGVRFFDRPDVRGAIDLVRRAGFDVHRCRARRGHPRAVGRQARVRRRHHGRPRRRGSSRTDRGARHAARHPRDAVTLRCPRGCRQLSLRSSTDDARPSARDRPTA